MELAILKFLCGVSISDGHVVVGTTLKVHFGQVVLSALADWKRFCMVSYQNCCQN